MLQAYLCSKSLAIDTTLVASAFLGIHALGKFIGFSMGQRRHLLDLNGQNAIAKISDNHEFRRPYTNSQSASPIAGKVADNATEWRQRHNADSVLEYLLSPTVL